MSDSAPIAQVAAREIPVTIQGSQIVEGTDRRELFTETVKTVLVFDNGAAVNLKARVAPGQSLFLRNELSGREILCRVIEAPAAGQEGCTDLEFTIHDPDFWNAQYEEDAAPAGAPETPEPQPQPEQTIAAAPAAEAAQVAETPVAPPPAIESANGSGATPGSGAGGSSLAIPPGQEIPGFSALLAQPQSRSEESVEHASGPQVDDAKEAEQLAGIVAKYARAIAKRASAKSAAKEAEQQSASDAAQLDDAIPVPTRKQKAFSTLAFRLHAIRELTVKKNPIALGIVACIVIGAALGVAWDVTGMLYPNRKPIVGMIRMKPPTSSAKPKAVASKTTAPAKPVNGAATPATAVKTQPPAAAPTPATPIAKTPTATTANVKPVHAFASPVNSATQVNGGVGTDFEATEPERGHRVVGPQKLIPAKIISQYQPYLPPWAKALDVDGVVRLDAVIDEKGNVKAIKVLSGPRALESAAEGAVGLWLFAPAISDGKPTASHMTITVEFQR
jgi:periplasmic protein TonB